MTVGKHWKGTVNWCFCSTALTPLGGNMYRATQHISVWPYLAPSLSSMDLPRALVMFTFWAVVHKIHPLHPTKHPQVMLSYLCYHMKHFLKRGMLQTLELCKLCVTFCDINTNYHSQNKLILWTTGFQGCFNLLYVIGEKKHLKYRCKNIKGAYRSPCVSRISILIR